MTERFPRLIFQSLLEPFERFPSKTLNLVASARGTLTVEAALATGKGDRIELSHALDRSEALDIITALSEWVASPDSIVRENPDGTPITLADAAAAALRSVPGVEGVFLDDKTIYAAARELELVNRQASSKRTSGSPPFGATSRSR